MKLGGVFSDADVFWSICTIQAAAIDARRPQLAQACRASALRLGRRLGAERIRELVERHRLARG